MKKMMYGLSLVLAIGIMLAACQKETGIPNSVSSSSSKSKTNVFDKSGDFGNGNSDTNPSDGVWITPTGIVIPYGQRENWEAWVDSMTIIMGIEKKGYRSQHCTGPGFNCGLKCVEARRYRDCVREEACAPCYNCGCTPVLK